jgi:hypothetical protein
MNGFNGVINAVDTTLTMAYGLQITNTTNTSLESLKNFFLRVLRNSNVPCWEGE